MSAPGPFATLQAAIQAADDAGDCGALRTIAQTLADHFRAVCGPFLDEQGAPDWDRDVNGGDLVDLVARELEDFAGTER